MLKYTAAYIIPILANLSFLIDEISAFTSIVFAFMILPLIELFLPSPNTNIESSETEYLKLNRLYDYFLYLNIPIVYGSLTIFAYTALNSTWSTQNLLAYTFSLGIVLAVNGLNVAHELGHRSKKYEIFFAKSLLLPAHFLHYYIEHNRGHHKMVATSEDPVTARKNEMIYTYLIRAIFGSYKNAWKLEKRRLSKKQKSSFTIQNEMLRFTVFSTIYISLLFCFLPLKIAFAIFSAGIVAMVLLQTIDYIEHYGLTRKKKENGKFERTSPTHSWNSNAILGRIILYELTRHSDHHYLASKKYQLLDHHNESPELPFGYPASMLLSYFPPLWFKIMNKRIAN